MGPVRWLWRSHVRIGARWKVIVMMGGSGGMWMIGGMAAVWVLAFVTLVLAIAALVKYLRT
jgi:uncharacterized membrane protein